MKNLLVLLTFVLLALSGCISDDDSTTENSVSSPDEDTSSETIDENTPPSDTESEPNESSNDPNEPEEPVEAPEEPETTLPPGVWLNVSVPAGFAPSNVNFTFGIENFENDVIVEWTLDVDGDGTPESEGTGGLPAGYLHTFTDPGNFNATFIASDGDVSANVTVGFSIVAEPTLEPQEAIQLTGTTTGLPSVPMVGSFSASEFATDNKFVVEHGAQVMTISLSYSSTTDVIDDLDYELVDPTGASVYTSEEIGPEPDRTYSGLFAGEWNVRVIPYDGAGEISYTIDITFS